MKYLRVLFLACLLIISCNNDDPELSEYQILQMTIESIESNVRLLDETLVNISDLIDAEGGIEQLLKEPSRLAFIEKMYNLTKDEYSHAVADLKTDLQLGDWSYSFTNRSYTKLRDHLEPVAQSWWIEPSIVDVKLMAYSTEVDDSLARAKDHDKWVNVTSVNIGGHKSGGGGSARSYKITIDDLIYIRENIGALIIEHADYGILEPLINEFVAQDTYVTTETKSILISLLKPAIQSGRPDDSVFFEKLFGGLAVAQQIEIGQKIRYAAFMAAIDYLVSNEYDDRNELTASVGVNREVCHAVLVLAWARVQ